MNDKLKNIKAFLFDLDGTIHIGNQVYDGAIDVINFLKNNGYPCRFVTNMTTKTLSGIYQHVKDLGLPILQAEIINTTKAAVTYLRKIQNPTCYFVLNEEVKADFKEFLEDKDNPGYIIVGDIGDRWNYSLMNDLFNKIMNGSRLIALHKGRYWQTESGLQMDIGAFIAGLEYTTGQKALSLGKPSKEFYQTAIEGLNIPFSDIAMIGDDINNDVGGAQNLGMVGVLVKTGKYRADLIKQSEVKPDLIIDSIEELLNNWR